jgi:hypothetical protein
MLCKCEGAAGTAPEETTRVEIITRRVRERNRRGDEHDVRLDLLWSLRIDLADVARAKLLGTIAELVALSLMPRKSARELRILLRRPA